MGNLTSRTAFIGGDILGRHDRTEQVRGLFDPVVRLAQATLTLQRRSESFRIRRLNGA